MDGTPAIRYAWSGKDDVAWSETGDGPAVVIGGWWMSHLERDWGYPPLRAFIERLSSRRRVIRLDAPGSGLSRSRARTPAELSPHVDAMGAVLDAAKVDRVSLFAGSSGCPVAVAFAASHPDRVRRMVLTGSYLSGAAITSPETRAAIVNLVRQNWGVSSRVMADIFFPDATPEQRRAYAVHQRSTGSADRAAAALEAVYAFDATDVAADVTTPTLVVHRRGDRAIPLEQGIATAHAIPGAELEVLDGSAHHPWHGDTESIIRASLAFDEETDAGATSPEQTARLHRATLSARETEILLLVAEGLTDSEIAARLFLSPHTVHRHVANARTKLGVPSRTAAAAWAIRASEAR